MSVVHNVMTAGLIALTIAGASLATATAADARSHDAFWGGVAAGAVGGVLLSEAVRPAYPYAVYPAPAYRSYYRDYYRPACYSEWRHDRWGYPYRVDICR
ncbi:MULTISPECIES: hypothetical protein [unclassified Sinorhizobium]|uniref:hypothetical protein n=1 Tax=unclassified Sinorhizobium TaxID=2613772 RepID=UPI0035255E65